MKLRTCLCVLLGLALWVVLAVISSTPGKLVTINSYGRWSLQQLGSSKTTLSGNGTRVVAAYLLPRDAAQGPDGWYQLWFHFQIELDRDSGPGMIYVSASTNDRTAAQIQFETIRMDDLLLTHWNTLDLIQGEKDYFTASPTIEVYFNNYLQDQGVIPGENTLSISLESNGDAKVKDLIVFEDSGIEYTPLGPPRLKMQVSLPNRRAAVGDVFIIGFTLANSGGYPAKAVTVRAIYPQAAMRMQSEESKHFEAIDAEAKGEFSLEALQAGDFEIILLTNGDSGGRLATKIGVEIDPTRSVQATNGGTDWFSWPFVFSVFLAIVSVLFLTGDLWSRRSAGPIIGSGR